MRVLHHGRRRRAPPAAAWTGRAAPPPRPCRACRSGWRCRGGAGRRWRAHDAGRRRHGGLDPSRGGGEAPSIVWQVDWAGCSATPPRARGSRSRSPLAMRARATAEGHSTVVEEADHAAGAPEGGEECGADIVCRFSRGFAAGRMSAVSGARRGKVGWPGRGAIVGRHDGLALEVAGEHAEAVARGSRSAGCGARVRRGRGGRRWRGRARPGVRQRRGGLGGADLGDEGRQGADLCAASGDQRAVDSSRQAWVTDRPGRSW